MNTLNHDQLTLLANILNFSDEEIAEGYGYMREKYIQVSYHPMLVILLLTQNFLGDGLR